MPFLQACMNIDAALSAAEDFAPPASLPATTTSKAAPTLGMAALFSMSAMRPPVPAVAAAPPATTAPALLSLQVMPVTQPGQAPPPTATTNMGRILIQNLHPVWDLCKKVVETGHDYFNNMMPIMRLRPVLEALYQCEIQLTDLAPDHAANKQLLQA